MNTDTEKNSAAGSASKWRWKWIYSGAILLIFVTGSALIIVFADDIYEGSRYRASWIPAIVLDDDSAMRALSRSGKIISPEHIITTVERQYNGQVTDLDFDRGLLHYYYEIELSDNDKAEWDIEVDARSGEVLYKQRDWD